MKESYLVNKDASVHELASLDQRFLGQLLDSLVVIAVVGLSIIPASISEELGKVTLICGFLFAVYYLLFADGFKGGQSYGKRIMKTAVIDATTRDPCSFGKSFVRNLLLSVLGIIDWAFIFGRMRQRLGDKVANTLVVKVPPG